VEQLLSKLEIKKFDRRDEQEVAGYGIGVLVVVQWQGALLDDSRGHDLTICRFTMGCAPKNAWGAERRV
jgi:hypothetical protein